MAFDFSAPSFSLGLDLDFEEDKEKETLNPNIDNDTSVKEEDEDDDCKEIQPRSSLKRLRRGTSPPPHPPPPVSPLRELASHLDHDDDIESFSSEEEDIHSSLHFNACSSSKVPLHSRGILSSQSTSKSKIKILPTLSASTSGNSMAISNKDPFPSLTISPLRKLNLLESYPSFSHGYTDEGNKNKEQPLTVDNDVEQPQNRPVLKRLRCGAAQSTPLTLTKYENMNAEIEDISSQEFVDNHHPEIPTSLQNKQSSSTLKSSVISQVHNTSIPSSFEASTSKNSFKKSSISPVRRINLIISDSDSDSGDPSSSKIKTDAKKKKSVQFQSDTLWKEYSSKEKNITKIPTPAITKISTPALDDFCDEYFKSSKSNTPSICSSKVIDPENSIDDFETIFKQNSGNGKSDHNWNTPHSKPPAYRYFFHEDERVRSLVRERLPHFVPNGVDDCRESQQKYEEEINYMGQFGSGTGLTQGNKNNKIGSSNNTKGVKQRRPRKTSKSKESSEKTGEWVNPRNSASVPRDAGKRRVSAEGSQAGHWFTGQDGRKVYVSKNGQELAGQFAYRQYRRESGIASKKGKKVRARKSKKN